MTIYTREDGGLKFFRISKLESLKIQIGSILFRNGAFVYKNRKLEPFYVKTGTGAFLYENWKLNETLIIQTSEQLYFKFLRGSLIRTMPLRLDTYNFV